jgi:hypothetical protein
MVMRRGCWSGVLVVLISAALGGCTASADVTEVDATDYFEQLMDGAASFMSGGEDAEFCESWASDRSFCAMSLETWRRDDSPRVDPSTVSFTIDELDTGTQRVKVDGQFTDGTRFSSAIEIVQDEGEVRAVDPVYWVSRTIN